MQRKVYKNEEIPKMSKQGKIDKNSQEQKRRNERKWRDKKINVKAEFRIATKSTNERNAN